MISHIQFDENGLVQRRLDGAVLTYWDENNLCTPMALEVDGKAAQFRVFSLALTPEPEHNRITQRVVELDPVLQGDQWMQQWAVEDLPPEQVAINRTAAQAVSWERIKTERDRRKYLGVKVGAHWFHSDDSSRIQQLGLVLLGQGLPAVQWKTLTFTPPPVFVPMTPALAVGIMVATAQSDTAVFAAAEAHRQAMEASAMPEAYDHSGGWPPSIEDEANAAGIQFGASLF